MSNEDKDRLSRDQVVSLVHDKKWEPHFVWGASHQAAVLVPMFEQEDGWHLLLTKRTDFLPNHKGQISFPGGRAEPADLDSAATALRETEEEIGIDAGKIYIVGRLDDFVTHYGVLISPVVGIVQWPVDMVLSPIEVSRVFTVPLAWFSDAANLENRRYFDPDGRQRPVLFYRAYQGDEVWGITAFIIHDLVRTLNK